jgi:WD40 repeat protein
VLAADQHYLQSFEHEARTAASLEHPHILAVHDFGQHPADDGLSIITYLVTPYISGGSLRDWIKSSKGIMPPEESLNYLAQAAQAIDYAHSKQVIHRDIKPGNMLLQDSWLLLSDFGIAKLLQTTTSLSQTNAGAGTPEYMAPEQIQGRAVPASDLYSLAIIAYQLFAGTVPFKGPTAMDTMMSQVLEVLKPARSHNPNIPPEVDAVLARGLAKQPEQRPATCVELVNELARAWNIRRSDSLDPDATVLAPWNKNTPSNGTAFAQQDMATVPQTGETTLNQHGSAAGMPFMGANGPWGTTNAAVSMQGVQAQVQGMLPDGQPGQFIQPPEQPAKKGISRRALIVGGATVGTLTVLGVAGGVGIPMLLNEQKKPNTQGGQRPKGPLKLVEGTAVFMLSKHVKTVDGAVWDPQSRYLITVGDDNAAYLWDIATAASKRKTNAPRQTLTLPLNSWQFQNTVTCGWSANSKYVVLLPLLNNTIYVTNALQQNSTLQQYAEKPSDQFANLMYGYAAWKLGSNDTFAVTKFTDFNTTVCVEIWQISKHDAPVMSLSYAQRPTDQYKDIFGVLWSATGKYLVGVTQKYEPIIWDTRSGKVIQRLPVPLRKKNPYLHDGGIAIATSPVDDERILISDSDAAHLYDITSGKVLFSISTDDLRPHTPANKNMQKGWVAILKGLDWSPNGQYIAGCFTNDNRVYIWDAQVQSNSRVKDGLRMPIMQFGDVQGHDKLATTNVSWSPDGKYITTTSYDNTAIVWQVDADA